MPTIVRASSKLPRSPTDAALRWPLSRRSASTWRQFRMGSPLESRTSACDEPHALNIDKPPSTPRADHRISSW
eukprot:scaffold15468_cov111-Isochrysis_galbana.AAC.6